MDSRSHSANFSRWCTVKRYRCRHCTLLRCDYEGDACQECAEREDTVEVAPLPDLSEPYSQTSWPSIYDLVYGGKK